MPQRLTVYLMDESVEDFSDALEESTSSKSKKVDSTYKDYLAFYYNNKQSAQPKWLAFVNEALDESIELENGTSHAALLLVKARGRIFALTFSYGRTLLNLSKIEFRFGLKVLLNKIDHQKIRSLHTKLHDSIVFTSNIQASKQTELSEFGVDYLSTVLKGAVGKGNEPGFDTTMLGADAFVITRDIDISEIKQFCEELFDAFKSDEYKKQFGWIDHLNTVQDSSIVETLDNLLLTEIKNKLNDNTYLAVPDPIEWDEITAFTIQGSRRVEYQDLDFAEYLSKIGEEARNNLSIEVLKKRKVAVIYSRSNELTPKWSLFNCIISEQRLDDDLYILIEGQWMRVEKTFVEKIDKQFNLIPDSSVTLPNILENEVEGTYNSRISADYPDEYLNFDKVLIRAEGAESRIEFCDILSSKGHVIHVKRRSSSSTLSHLFAQGLVSAQTFMGDNVFRRELVHKIRQMDHSLKDRFLELFPENGNEVNKNSFKIVYAIIPNSSKSGRNCIPFFSRLNLVKNAKYIRELGLGVELLIIPKTS